MTTERVEIGEDDILYRRLAIKGHLNEDGSVNSNAFKLRGKPDPEISVDLAKLTTREDSIKRAKRSDACIGILRVRDIRSMGLRVAHKPTPENPAHCVIEGNKSKSNCRDLAKLITEIYKPTTPKPE